MDYLNTGDIPDSATAPGLEEVREHLKIDRMTKDELKAYYRHLDNIVILRDNIYTERAEGRAEGREEGRAEGREEERYSIALSLKELNTPIDVIIKSTGLSEEEIATL